MKLLDLHDALCGDGGQPWSRDSLFYVEGLNYHEALTLLKMHQAGEALPNDDDLKSIVDEREAAGFDLATTKGKLQGCKAIPLVIKAAKRRAITASLGVTDPREQAALSREAGTALDRVQVAARKVGVKLDLSRRGSRRELLDVATQIYAARSATLKREKAVLEPAIRASVSDAAALIAEVDMISSGAAA